MIRINRGPEPAELAAVRRNELARVRLLAATHSPSGDEIGEEYAVVVQILFDLQHGKCCYCEAAT